MQHFRGDSATVAALIVICLRLLILCKRGSAKLTVDSTLMLLSVFR